MALYTPTFGTSGVYTLKAPFNNLLVPNVAYTCIGLRTFAEIISAGGDPQEEYYTPNNLLDADYAADVTAGACIVTLQASGFGAIHVPNTYIGGAPEIGGVPYTAMALVIKIGSVPDSLDLSVVSNKIAADVLEMLGVEANVVPVVQSPTVNLTVDQAKAVEAARQGKIGTVITDYTKLVQTQTQLESAQQKIAELEAFIVANIQPPA